MKNLVISFLLFLPIFIFSNEDNTIDKKLYESCEKLDNDKYNEETCKLLLAQKQAGYTEVDSFNLYYVRKYYVGITNSYYRFSYNKKYRYYNYSDDSYYDYYEDIQEEYNYISASFEYPFHEILFIGSKFGAIISSGYEKEMGAALGVYFRFNPLFMFRYFTMGISGGVLSYYINDKENGFQPIFDAYIGLKFFSTMRFIIEGGANDHFGLSFGIIF
jgi:hypothetical protein